jgi:phosphate:Na+ symporter
MEMLEVFGGLALFLYGLSRVAEEFIDVLGHRLLRLLRYSRNSPWIGVLSGAGVTALTQSATAIGVMTAKLGRSGVLQSREALAIMLGATVGATMAVQLASWRIADWALPIIAFGFCLTLVQSRIWKSIGTITLALGLAFLGLRFMLEGLAPIGQLPVVQQVLAQAEQALWLAAVLGLVLTLILHSSNAPVVLAMAMLASGLIQLPVALAVMLGANAATAVNVWMMTLGQGETAKRCNIAHMAIKVGAAVMLLPALGAISPLVSSWGADSARTLANMHTLFNLVAALACLPLLSWIDILMRKWLPDPPMRGPRPKYIDANALNQPDLAYNLAFREMGRVADHVLRMARAAFDARDAEPALLEHVRKEEEMVDVVVHELVKYLGQLHPVMPAERLRSLLAMCTSLEGIGDLLKRHLRQRHKLWQQGLEFSQEGKLEIDRITDATVDRARVMLTALATGDVQRCRSQLATRPALNLAIENSRLAHLQRLAAGREDSMLSSSVHLDILTLIEQINTELDQIANNSSIAYTG